MNKTVPVELRIDYTLFMAGCGKCLHHLTALVRGLILNADVGHIITANGSQVKACRKNLPPNIIATSSPDFWSALVLNQLEIVAILQKNSQEN